MNKMMLVFLLSPFLLLASCSAHAQIANETPLMTKDLPDVPGKEGLIEIVLLAPGEVTPAHRHNADVFVYVLEGSIITRPEGRKSQTVHAGEAFYESPTDVHIASRKREYDATRKASCLLCEEERRPPTVAVGKGNAAH